MLAIVGLTILATIGLGLLATGTGARHQATTVKDGFAARLAAEAGYEKAVFWMSQQQDMLRRPAAGNLRDDGDSDFSHELLYLSDQPLRLRRRGRYIGSLPPAPAA